MYLHGLGGGGDERFGHTKNLYTLKFVILLLENNNILSLHL